MKLHGWCRGCRRIKRGTPDRAQLLGKGVPIVLCDDCKAEGKV